MAVAGLQDLPLEIFSGLVNDLAASDLPPGASPALSDCAFELGSVLTRPGLGAGAITGLAGNPTVNYLKTFTDLQENQRLLYLDSLGVFRQDFPQGTETIIDAALTPGDFAQSTTLFGREYVAFSDGKGGRDIPRQWDGTNYDRVSQCGPGAPPIAVDGGSSVLSISSISQPAAFNLLQCVDRDFSGNPLPAAIADAYPLHAQLPADFVAGILFTIAGVGGGWNGANYTVTSAYVSGGTGEFTFLPTPGVANVVGAPAGTAQSQLATVVTVLPHGLIPGKAITLAGTTGAIYDGNFVVFSIIDDFTFTFNMASAGNAANGAVGTITAAGHIPAGIHKVSVLFVTRQGYLTRPAPPSKYTAAGGQTALVSGIPTGPPNVIARILIFTTAGGANYFYLASNVAFGGDSMVINDNLTTTVKVDFDDTTLASGQDVADLFTVNELGECLGFIGYSSRLFGWGERSKLQNLLNTTFDGGFSGNVPLGWTADPTSGPGGSQETATVIWGNAYRITGDGATAVRGLISQPAFQDWLGTPIIQTNVAYSARVRLLKGGGLAQGTFRIELYSPSLGVLGSFTVAHAAIGATFAEFSGAIAGIPNALGNPTDLLLRVSLTGTPTNNGYVIADNIEIFPTNQPLNSTIVNASYAEDPESYNGLTGFLNVAPSNGQAMRAAFVLREKLYLVKERSFYVTEDDGQNEPDSWAINEVSNKVGTYSAQGVDVGEEWAMIAARQGLYIFWGPEPVKVSQEIQPTWNRINWNAGQFIWVRIDDINKRVLVGVPIDGSTTVNRVLMFDYRGLDSAAEIADHWTVRYSSYTGKILAIGNAPKWSPWTMSINAAAIVERNDGAAHLFMGNGTGTGKIYDLLDPQQPGSGGVYNDDGAGIPWSYSTYYVPGHQDEQALHLGAHRKLFGYLTGLIEGAGQMDISAQQIGNYTPIKLPSIQTGKRLDECRCRQRVADQRPDDDHLHRQPWIAGERHAGRARGPWRRERRWHLPDSATSEPNAVHDRAAVFAGPRASSWRHRDAAFARLRDDHEHFGRAV